MKRDKEKEPNLGMKGMDDLDMPPLPPDMPKKDFPRDMFPKDKKEFPEFSFSAPGEVRGRA